ncbi:hypothetical protein GCM10009678_55530 [Actinomadura kijaniata]|uniref:Putative phage infection (PIP) family protein YhgE n=1 Tax=Actinomadura namibiensis TaxID=182080 RepID=A0A7W3QKB5_ACTNM|nr:hypothetical protein [Actinomadura namibiensis]MBA8950230.1 putative phage infection (PIP) family protein YhgE [Actinomadura namibiensis]
MRMSTKLVGVLAIGGVMLTSTACGPLSAVTGGGDKASACNNIKTELETLSQNAKMPKPDLSNPSAGLSQLKQQTAQMAQQYQNTASRIRSEGDRAGGDVQSAAGKLAGDLDSMANMLRNSTSGGATGMNSFSQITQNAADLGKACGFSGTFRFGS